LTPAGRDYLKALAATVFVSTLLNVKVALALALALAISAFVSLILLRRFSRAMPRMTAEPSRVTTFKGEGRSLRLLLNSRIGGWITVQALPMAGTEGLDAEIVSGGPGFLELSVKPRYAKRFDGVALEFRVTDVLGLFAVKSLEVNLNLVVDSLPVALLLAPRRPRLGPLALGERAAGTPGSGQEFYGLDEYQPFMEAKNILWKRIGRRADDKIVVKVRESNIPREVRLAYVDPYESGRARLEFVDRACEALATLGGTILEGGSLVTIDIPSARNGASITSADTEGLADAIMSASTRSCTDLDVLALERDDVILTDNRSYERSALREAYRDKPVLLMAADPAAVASGRRVFAFSGREELVGLAEMVVNR
jgi:uncharacterized protein (DUF58 family)